MENEWQHRCKAYRFVAYSAVAFSVVAILGTATTLPMVYNYVHHVQRTMHAELNYCRTSAREIWEEVSTMKSTGNRTARQAGYAEYPGGGGSAGATGYSMGGMGGGGGGRGGAGGGSG
ncbi:unnamed protein product, partial [Heligmosomoides polygyrus]|uniref:Col_cuticle_N domain-containing protein n=1 Tax=Heligmosomoides polygyrus TaxID=6339 RepID=A0A183GRB9_HELPZ